MKVRSCQETDQSEYVSGWFVVHGEGFLDPEPADAETMDFVFRSAVGDPDTTCLVLEEEGKVIGGLISLSEKSGLRTFGMWVLAGARGNGGGRRLLEYALHRDRDRDTVFEIEVRADNESALRLYEDLGFVEIGSTTSETASGTVTFLRLRLEPWNRQTEPLPKLLASHRTAATRVPGMPTAKVRWRLEDEEFAAMDVCGSPNPKTSSGQGMPQGRPGWSS
jgi:ribosomal protein S18 acetylase RimI-like enzyme